MSKKRASLLITLLALFAMVFTACAPAAPAGEGAAPAAEGEEPMTEVGTPRRETLIIDSLDGRTSNPTQFNPFMSGTRFNTGYHMLALSHLWEMNTTTGEQFGGMAEDLPEPLNDDYTHFRIKLREDLKWSDGQPLTTADIGYTIDMVLNNPELPYNGFLSQVIDRYEIVDDTTMELWTKRSEPRLSYTLGVTVWGDSFYIIPKHIFENEDPNTFMFYPPRYQRPVQAQ